MDSEVFPGERGEVILQTPEPRELPILNHRNEILEALKTNQVNILISPTGSGKTTQVPQMALETNTFAQIVVTQPRIIAARELANRVIEETEQQSRVGYYTSREGSETNQSDQDIAFLTDGKAAMQMLTGRFDNDKKTLIVIDEVHEWNIHTEMLIALAAEKTNPSSVNYNPNLSFVIMSATADGEGLTEHFAHTSTGFIEVPTKSPYPIEEVYKSCSAEEAILDEITQNPESKVLAFLPGVSEIRSIRSTLRKSNIATPVVILHGKLSKRQQARATKDYPDGVIILATNVAETSLTINNVNCVVDTGLQRIDTINYDYDPNGVEELNLIHAPASSVIQRGGRTGRTCPGRHIYVSHDNKTPPMSLNQRRRIQEFQTPSIQRSRLDSLVLSLLDAGIDINSLPFYHKPSGKSVEASKQRLFNIGAIDELDRSTRRGRVINRLPLDPELACMLAIGYEKKIGKRAMSTLITATAIAGLGGIFDRSPKRQLWQGLLDSSEELREKDSDYFAQVNAYAKLINEIPEDEWGNYHINEYAAGLVQRDREVLARRLDIDLQAPAPVDTNDRNILLEIINASRINQIWRKQNGLWRNIFTGAEVEQTPSSVVAAASGKIATASYFRLGQSADGPGARESIQDLNLILAPDLSRFAKSLGHLVTTKPVSETLSYDMKLKKWFIQVSRRIGTLVIDECMVDAEDIENRPSNDEFSRSYRLSAVAKLKSDKTAQRKPVESIDDAQKMLNAIDDLFEPYTEAEISSPNHQSRVNPLVSKQYGFDPITEEPLYAYQTAQGKWVTDVDTAIRSLRAKIRYLERRPTIIANKEEKQRQRELETESRKELVEPERIVLPARTSKPLRRIRKPSN